MKGVFCKEPEDTDISLISVDNGPSRHSAKF